MYAQHVENFPPIKFESPWRAAADLVRDYCWDRARRPLATDRRTRNLLLMARQGGTGILLLALAALPAHLLP